MSQLRRGIRATLAGLLTNACLVLLKLLAGLLGNSYALVADAIESSIDVFASLVVWRGLAITDKPPDDDYPYGYGKAESIAAAIVSLMLIGSALGILIVAIQEILIPHYVPRPFTLIVLGAVIVCKEILFRRVVAVGQETGSTAVMTDAWHHRSDAIVSAAAFIGIAIAIWGGPGWESADDWAAAAAAVIIGVNGVRLLRRAIDELMDRTPQTALLETIANAARATPGVRDIEKLRVRKLGPGYFIDLHVQAEPTMILRDAHIVGGKVKGAIRAAVPLAADVLVHMEPFESDIRPPLTRDGYARTL